MTPHVHHELVGLVYFHITVIPTDKLTAIRVTTSVRDHLRNVKRTVTKHITNRVVVTSFPDDSALASVLSPSGKRTGILREISEGSLKKRFVEVWRGSRLEAMKEVTKIHEVFNLNRALFPIEPFFSIS